MTRIRVPERFLGLRRRPNLAIHLSGLALLFMAPGVLVAGVVEWGAGGPEVGALFGASGVLFVVGLVAWASTTVPARPTASVTLAAVALTWMVAAVGGAVPYVFADAFPRIDDALFESVSGFTGTGSTVLSPIEDAARGVLFWRSTTQWYGGMGMVVLAVAVLPFLGIGGMSLLAAESPVRRPTGWPRGCPRPPSASG